MLHAFVGSGAGAEARARMVGVMIFMFDIVVFVVCVVLVECMFLSKNEIVRPCGGVKQIHFSSFTIARI